MSEQYKPSSEEIKKAIISKIMALSAVSQAHGQMTDDGQAAFIGAAIVLILKVSQNESHVMLLDKYLDQFVDEVDILTKEKTVMEYLVNAKLHAQN